MLVQKEDKAPVVHWFRDETNSVTVKIEMSPNSYNADGFIDGSPNAEEIQRLESIAEARFGMPVTYVESAVLL